MKKKYKSFTTKSPDGNDVVVIEAKKNDDGDLMPLIFDEDAPDNLEPLDALGLLTREMPKLRQEAKERREKSKELENMLSQFVVGKDEEGNPQFFDVESATKAMDIAKQVERGELVDSGKRDKVIQQMTEDFNRDKAALLSTHGEQLSKAEAERNAAIDKYKAYRIQSAFQNSKFLKEKTTLGAGVAAKVLGSHFTIDESDRIIAKDANGDPVYSNEKAGEFAPFDEALKTIWNRWDEGANYLRGTANAGDGDSRASAGGNGQRLNTASDYYRAGFERRSN